MTETKSQLIGEPPYYTTPMAGNGGGQGAYHTDPECTRLARSNATQRPEGYIRWHELVACQYCIGTNQ